MDILDRTNVLQLLAGVHQIYCLQNKYNDVGENKYYTTTNNVTKTINTHAKQKDLGITFDSKLTFDEHISQVVNKAAKKTKLIIISFQFLDKHTFLPLYKTMVTSHIDYAMVVWHPYKIKHKVALENI